MVAATTAGSELMALAKRPGKRTKANPQADMRAAPVPKATIPARRAAGVSREPTAQPTRTDPALPMPTAALKEKEASAMATWWAAMGTAPSRPARIPTIAKRPTSAAMWSPTGAPTFTARRISRGTGRRTQLPVTGTRPAAQATKAAWSQVATAVAMPEPTAPSGGIARRAPAHPGRPAPPKTSRRSRSRFTTFAITADITTALGAFDPCR